jgi:hypothetical protein
MDLTAIVNGILKMDERTFVEEERIAPLMQ